MKASNLLGAGSVAAAAVSGTCNPIKPELWQSRQTDAKAASAYTFERLDKNDAGT